MTDSQTAPVRRTYRRRNALNVSLTVAMDEDMRAKIEAEAIADGVSAADVIRMAVNDSLPRLRERRRKRAGRASGRHGRGNAVTVSSGVSTDLGAQAETVTMNESDGAGRPTCAGRARCRGRQVTALTAQRRAVQADRRVAGALLRGAGLADGAERAGTAPPWERPR